MKVEFPPLVFVDIETTGGSPANSRVLELAAIRYEQGRIIGELSTLIDAGEPVPPFITQLTGIHEGDQWGAPSFNGVARELMCLLEGAVFVAHNVGFDYGFIAAEYGRLDQDFVVPQLCTVKLARYLYPGYRSYKLSSVIERHNIEVENRHRAYDDAAALVSFYELARREHGDEIVHQAIASQLSFSPGR